MDIQFQFCSNSSNTRAHIIIYSIYIYIHMNIWVARKKGDQGFSIREVEIILFCFFSLSYKAGPSLNDVIHQFSTSLVQV